MEVTIVDGVVLLIVGVSALLAFSRGLTREALAIGGWVVAAIAAFYFTPAVMPLIQEAPVVGDILRGSCHLSVIAAFAAVFAVALIVVSIFTPLLSGAVQDSMLGPFDRGLGFLFGVARGLLLVAVVYVLYDTLVPDGERIEMVENSRSMSIIAETAGFAQSATPNQVPGWLDGYINSLIGPCDSPGIRGASAAVFSPASAA